MREFDDLSAVESGILEPFDDHRAECAAPAAEGSDQLAVNKLRALDAQAVRGGMRRIVGRHANAKIERGVGGGRQLEFPRPSVVHPNGGPPRTHQITDLARHRFEGGRQAERGRDPSGEEQRKVPQRLVQRRV